MRSAIDSQFLLLLEVAQMEYLKRTDQYEDKAVQCFRLFTDAFLRGSFNADSIMKTLIASVTCPVRFTRVLDKSLFLANETLVISFLVYLFNPGLPFRNYLLSKLKFIQNNLFSYRTVLQDWAYYFPHQISNYYITNFILLKFVCRWRAGIKSCDLLSLMRALYVCTWACQFLHVIILNYPPKTSSISGSNECNASLLYWKRYFFNSLTSLFLQDGFWRKLVKHELLRHKR